MNLRSIKKEAQKELSTISNLKELEHVSKKYLSKKGEIAKVFLSLKDLSDTKKREVGKEANLIKKEIESLIKKRKEIFKNTNINIVAGSFDVTRPAEKIERGHIHPLTQTQRQAQEIFIQMGFEIALGPEIEKEWYNFDALNIPKHHPARDMWDTFWLDKEVLLRTHTSPVQVRYMEKHQPPLKIIVPGKVFRNEATDASHDAEFYQLEGLVVDKDISVSHFKAIIEVFLERFFKSKVEIRLRPGFFPFTEPSFEIDAKWAGGKWLELMGAGMVHPKVFESAGIDTKKWKGFAFGVGLDRLAMIKYKIGDIRMFHQNDLRFLKQF